MKERIKEFMNALFTPERPLKWGRILLLIDGLLYIIIGVLAIITKQKGLGMACSVITGTGYLVGSIYLLRKRKPLQNDYIVRTGALLCAFGEGLFALWALSELITNRDIKATLPGVLSIATGLLAMALFIYIFAYYFLDKHEDEDKPPIHVRHVMGYIILGIILLNCIPVIPLFAETRGAEDALATIIGRIAEAILAPLLTYGAWFRVIASDQYEDEEVTRAEAGRAYKKQQKQAQRAELKKMFDAATNRTSGYTRPPHIRLDRNRRLSRYYGNRSNRK